MIQGASGFKGTELGVMLSRTLLSTQGIIFGGFINGKLNEGRKWIAAVPFTKGVLMKAN